jgi:hypothetical protein
MTRVVASNRGVLAWRKCPDLHVRYNGEMVEISQTQGSQENDAEPLKYWPCRDWCRAICIWLFGTCRRTTRFDMFGAMTET